MSVDPSLSNKKLAAELHASINDLYSYLSTPEWEYCTGYPQRNEDPKCSVLWKKYHLLSNWWNGRITEYDPERAVIEIDHYSGLANRNTVSYAAHFERVERDTLEIRVKSVGLYCTRMDDDGVADAWKAYLSEKLSTD